MPTYPVPKRFRLNSAEASVLDSVARENHLSKSSVVRIICLFGPEPSSLHLNDSARVIEGAAFFDERYISKVYLEVIRQSTNVGQGISGFEKFLQGIGVENISEENIFADPERRPTMEAIAGCLRSMSPVIGQVKAAIIELGHDEVLVRDSSLCLDARVHTRLEDDLYELLCLKAEAFGISVSDYFRLCVRYLPEIVSFAHENTTEDGLRLETLCLEVIELDALLSRFSECGRVLNDAVRYLNSEMVGYYRLFETMLMLKLRTLLGKLEVAVGFYRCFCDDFGFKFEE